MDLRSTAKPSAISIGNEGSNQEIGSLRFLRRNYTIGLRQGNNITLTERREIFSSTLRLR